MHILENDIKTYSAKGEILICSDTNARTGELNETIDISADENFIPIPSDLDGNHTISSRNSKDKISCARGKELIELCTTCDLLLLNGRTIGDMFGRYTSFQPNGNSVIDYCIVSDRLFTDVFYFSVSEPTLYLSDHSKFSVLLHANYQHTTKHTDNTFKSMPQMYIWQSTSGPTFKQLLTLNK